MVSYERVCTVNVFAYSRSHTDPSHRKRLSLTHEHVKRIGEARDSRKMA